MRAYRVNNIFGNSSPKKAFSLINFHHMCNTGGVSFSQTVMKYGLNGYEAVNFNPESIDQLHEKAQELKEKLNSKKLYLHGHWTNGLEKILGTIAYKFTLLRSPLERFLSEFFWERRSSAEINSPFLLMRELCDWIDVISEVGHANFYCSEIVTDQEKKPLFHVHLRPANLTQATPQSAYALARKRVQEDYSFVGITEFFEESLFFFFREMGWPKIGPWTRGPHAPGRGSAANKFKASDLPAGYFHKLQNLMEGDLQLYAECKKKFEEDIKKNPLGGDFQKYKNMGSSEEYKK